MELHLKIPAEKWCITKREFFSFIEDVRRMWRRGDIPDDAEAPNPKHLLGQYGPNLYQVNEHYVKPVTLAAGGMSYALMKHPEGLNCQVFVSHAWSEGVFELSSHLTRAWPGGLGMRNMYCCLLANPQNLDLTTMLAGPPIESPFAKAMQRASHVLVIPNDTVSIYTRLWCVYEIYLATQWKKTCIIPAKPPSSIFRSRMAWTTVLPSIVGLLLGGCWAIVLQYSDEAADGSVWLVDQVLFAVIALSFGMVLCDVLMELCRCEDGKLRTTYLRMQMCMQMVASSCIAPWLVLPCGFTSLYNRILHYGIPIGCWKVAVAFTLRHVQTQLENLELRKQASFLTFDDLEDATCSYESDEDQIREAIAGFEEDVITAITVLKSAGAYNTSIRRAHTKGQDIAGAGNSHVDMRLSAAMIPWTVCLIEELSAAHIWEDCSLPSELLTFALAAIIFLAMIATMVASRYWIFHGPDKVNFLIQVCIYAGIFAVSAPFAIAGLQGWAQVQHLPIFYRFAHTPASTACPSRATWFGCVLLRPCIAVIAAILSWVCPVWHHRKDAEVEANELERDAEDVDSVLSPDSL